MSLLTIKEAKDILLQKAGSFGSETVGLENAGNRVLAETVEADRDYPPFNRSSMDGYAVSYKDLENGIRQFEVKETIYAGETPKVPIGSGQCYKIMTGAPVPDNADIVIRREDTDEKKRQTEGGRKQITTVEILSSVWKPFLNISRRGEDLTAGEKAIAKGTLCEPEIIGLLASLGKNKIRVERLPRVALFTTGNEVVGVEEPVSPVQIRNSNRWLLQSSLKKREIATSIYAHLPDDRAILTDNLEKALGSSELIIMSGGVSAGDADFVPGVLEELGVQKLFHKIAIKPGKPVWCGITSGGAMVFALPGNPFSCLVSFTLLVDPWLRACFGLPVPEIMGLPLGIARKKKTLLDEFFPARITGSPARLETNILNGSGDIRMGLQANALALHPAGTGDLKEGTVVRFFPLND
ncbi:molybdopterin molybdotransferase MoeA [Flavitalea flava]